MKDFPRKNIFWFFASIDLIFFDLLSKWLAQTYLKTPREIIANFLKLETNYNTGIAFSLPVPNELMVLLAPLIIALLIWFIAKRCNLDRFATKLSLILIVAGGLGNFINRLWTGAVIDFIDFSFWPSFNLADAYLTVGAFLLIGAHVAPSKSC